MSMLFDMRRNDCRGCRIAESRSKCCYAKIKGCPCASCLIKMICRKGCDDLATHWHKVTNYEKLNKGDLYAQ